MSTESTWGLTPYTIQAHTHNHLCVTEKNSRDVLHYRTLPTTVCPNMWCPTLQDTTCACLSPIPSPLLFRVGGGEGLVCSPIAWHSANLLKTRPSTQNRRGLGKGLLGKGLLVSVAPYQNSDNLMSWGVLHYRTPPLLACPISHLGYCVLLSGILV